MMLLPMRSSPLKDTMYAETLDTGIRILEQIAANITMPILVIKCSVI